MHKKQYNVVYVHLDIIMHPYLINYVKKPLFANKEKFEVILICIIFTCDHMFKVTYILKKLFFYFLFK